MLLILSLTLFISYEKSKNRFNGMIFCHNYYYYIIYLLKWWDTAAAVYVTEELCIIVFVLAY